MTSTKPTLSSIGCVKPWIRKFTNTPRDAFFDQFADSHDAKFVEIIEGPHESDIKYSEVPLDSNNPKSAPDLSKVFEALKALAWHPLLVPLILMEQRIEGTAEKLTLMRDSLYSVEKRTGTHKNYRNDKYHEELNHYAYGDRVWERRHEQDVDFEAAPGKITSIASDCAMTEAKCQVNESLLDWIQELNDSLTKPNTDDGSWDTATSSIKMKISAFKTWSGNNRSRSIYLAKRAEAQMQAASSQNSQNILHSQLIRHSVSI
ncbi:hypothetical protein FPRO05_10092 [Fusarium proliferatum]|uniref:Uncharacterized protein n=1 Tax=Gibberella intermedia TaxID=948311 RepID=A0A365NEB2_GIBIN|nr:hypothetical protein FPRO05_10092 [Fusarium proliferatum]